MSPIKNKTANKDVKINFGQLRRINELNSNHRWRSTTNWLIGIDPMKESDPGHDIKVNIPVETARRRARGYHVKNIVCGAVYVESSGLGDSSHHRTTKDVIVEPSSIQMLFNFLNIENASACIRPTTWKYKVF